MVAILDFESLKKSTSFFRTHRGAFLVSLVTLYVVTLTTFFYKHQQTFIFCSDMVINNFLQTSTYNSMGGIMVSILASSVVDHGFEPQSGETKDYKIGISCTSAKHTALRRKSKDWLARDQNNVSEWSDMSTRRLLFQ